MGKRKPKHDNHNAEPAYKKEKKITGDEIIHKVSSDETGAPSIGETGRENKTKKSHNNLKNKKKGKARDKDVRKPVNMHNMLSEKLKKVQQNRLDRTEVNVVRKQEFGEKDERTDEEATQKKQENVTMKRAREGTENKSDVIAETPKLGNTNLNDEISSAEGTDLHRQKKKKNKKNKQDVVRESATETTGETSDMVGQGSEEIDPEKAAIRKKKREKRKQKKLEKERLKQQLKEKAGTANASAIDYLSQWKNSREEWRFLKVRQVWLLQNLYDDTLIKDDSFEILLEYLEGLKGISRETTVSEAEKVLAQSEDDSSDVKFDRAKQIIQLLS